MRKVYRGGDVEVSFDRDICIHVGECLLGLPAVFNLHQRPWVRPAEADVDAVAEVIRRCPSGALQYRRLDGAPGEQPPEPATVVPLRDGPLLIRGHIEVSRSDGTVETLPRATLCRCGLSNNKPFCDNSHLAGGFKAPGERIRIRVSPVRPTAGTPIASADDPRS